MHNSRVFSYTEVSAQRLRSLYLYMRKIRRSPNSRVWYETKLCPFWSSCAQEAYTGDWYSTLLGRLICTRIENELSDFSVIWSSCLEFRGCSLASAKIGNQTKGFWWLHFLLLQHGNFSRVMNLFTSFFRRNHPHLNTRLVEFRCKCSKSLFYWTGSRRNPSNRTPKLEVHYLCSSAFYDIYIFDY